ncbi:MAG: Holliday junction branch migration protein RuvA [Candidatus Krumholzibacteriia bacterium]
MIAYLKGLLVSAAPSCVVSVGGVGFELQIPDKDRVMVSQAQGEVSFHTYLHVREDQLTLFGFLRREDRELFTRLIEVSGVGPRIAINMLGEHPAERIVTAVMGGDHDFLRSLPGLGRKTAERLTVELKDKLKDLAGDAGAGVPSTAVAVKEEAILALTTLGMPRANAEKALEHVDWESQDASSLSSIVKQALKHATGI